MLTSEAKAQIEIMKLEELYEKVQLTYQHKGIAQCRYNALAKVMMFLKGLGVNDASDLNSVEKAKLKLGYEAAKGNKINGAENQAINDLYNHLNM